MSRGAEIWFVVLKALSLQQRKIRVNLMEDNNKTENRPTERYIYNSGLDGMSNPIQ